MAAFIIALIDVTDAKGYEEYKKATPGVIAKFGGKFIARGGRSRALEGRATPPRIVLLEFPTYEQAEKFYDSKEYAPVMAIRKKFSTGMLLAVEGC